MREKDEDEDDCGDSEGSSRTDASRQQNILSSSESEPHRASDQPIKSEEGWRPVGGALWPVGGAFASRLKQI